jgi:hypothetical protein
VDLPDELINGESDRIVPEEAASVASRNPNWLNELLAAVVVQPATFTSTIVRNVPTWFFIEWFSLWIAAYQVLWR